MLTSIELRQKLAGRVAKRSPQSLLFLSAGLAISLALPAAALVAQKPTEKSPQDEQAAELATQQHIQILKALDAEVDQLSKRADEIRRSQRDLRDHVRQACGLSPENVTPVMLGLERDRFALEIEVKLKSARRQQLAETIAKETAVKSDRADLDEVLQHMQKIVEARQAMLAAQQAARNAKASSEIEFKNAQAELAEAQIRVALRKEELTKPREDTSVERLNRQLLELSVDVTQDQLRLELLKERLTALAAVQNVLDEYKNAETELPRVLRMLDQIQERQSLMKIGQSQK